MRGGSYKVTGMALELLGTGQPPLNECSESHSAWRNSPRPWMPAAWHLLTYIFTQLLFLRTETKKKKQGPTAQQSCKEGLRGVHRVSPLDWKPVQKPLHPLWKSRCNFHTLWDTPDFPRLARWEQCGFPGFFHQRKREACSKEMTQSNPKLRRSI